MKHLIIVVLSITSSLISVSASQLVPPTVVALKNVANSLRFFKQDKGGLPTSWDDFLKSGYLSGDILQQAREKCDLENHYLFLGAETRVLIPSKNERIIIMARYPGLEGDNPGAIDQSDVQGRFLFVETTGGDIETRRYSEVALKRFFADAGLSLQDYSIDALPKIDAKIDKEKEGLKNKTLYDLRKKQESSAGGGNVSKVVYRNWIFLIVSAFLLFIGVICVINVRKKVAR